MQLNSRQTAPLPIAPTAQCDQYDGYFYVSSSNYTWQLQCTTNYIGSVISTENANSLAACIENCAAFNVANEPGSCLGINFNAANDAAVGQCTQYSDVQDLLLASEEGSKKIQKRNIQTSFSRRAFTLKIPHTFGNRAPWKRNGLICGKTNRCTGFCTIDSRPRWTYLCHTAAGTDFFWCTESTSNRRSNPNIDHKWPRCLLLNQHNHEYDCINH